MIDKFKALPDTTRNIITFLVGCLILIMVAMVVTYQIEASVPKYMNIIAIEKYTMPTGTTFRNILINVETNKILVNENINNYKLIIDNADGTTSSIYPYSMNILPSSKRNTSYVILGFYLDKDALPESKDEFRIIYKKENFVLFKSE